MPLGTVILMIVGVLIFFGFAHRVLDRMRLTDRAALVIIGLAVIGSFIDVTVATGPAELTINLGGSVIPVALAIWLIATADHAHERWRASFGAIVAGAALYGVSKVLPREAQALPVDPIYLFAVLAGLIGYILGRSRRGAFTAAILGVTLADIAAWVELLVTRTEGRAWLGGAGMLDATVIAGLVAVLLAEVIGESLELAGGGPRAGRLKMERAGGKRADMTERGSDAAPRQDQGAKRRGERKGTGQESKHTIPGGGNARSASALAPAEPLRATAGGPGSGDLDRVEMEESRGLEATRRSPFDETGRGSRALGRRAAAEPGSGSRARPGIAAPGVASRVSTHAGATEGEGERREQ
jgi:uncharacterized membrane protein